MTIYIENMPFLIYNRYTLKKYVKEEIIKMFQKLEDVEKRYIELTRKNK